MQALDHTLGRAPHVSRAGRSGRIEDLTLALRDCTDAQTAEDLRAQLIVLCMPVAASVAGRYAGRGVPTEDLEQVAYLGLVKAVNRFDPQAGHALLSFCVPTIRGEIRRYFRDLGWAIRPPRRIQDLQSELRRTEADLLAITGREPSVQELAQSLGVEVDAVLEARATAGCFAPASLDRPAGGQSDSVTVGDLLPAKAEEQEEIEARVILTPALQRLGERDRLILKLRFQDGLTQKEIAAHIGVTQMQVSRLLSRILRDIRSSVGTLDAPSETAARTSPR